MDHQAIREMLPQLAYDDLSDDDRRFLDAHLESCDDCRSELAQIRALRKLVSTYRPVSVTDAELREARLARRSPPDRTTLFGEFFDRLLAPPVRLALGGAFLLFVGVVGGFLLSSRTSGSDSIGGGFLRTGLSGTQTMPGEVRVANFKFVDRDEKSGDVEFEFDAVAPMRMRGNVNDPAVQSVLARALVSENNAGARLRAVNMIAGSDRAVTPMREDVKKALITTLQHDRNLGVRKEALRVLQEYLPDPDVTHAFLVVLTSEDNIGMRIAAINALDVSKLSGQPAGKEVLDVFKKKLQSDDNYYIRVRASEALKEVNQ